MHPRLRFTLAAAGASTTLILIGLACSSSTTAPSEPAGVAALRESLAPYSSLTLAKNAGYSTPITDCMSNGDAGAMGIHFANTALLDATADPLRPEALIYEPGPDNQASLVGVEFIVPYSAVARDASPPVLFGEQFSRNDVFNVWALHVWTHRSNPSGLFAPWNPRVHCS
ncbi:MAG TPA: hypothetical protein VH277_04350 [Gemmatimonadaceae bacterium]|jgi:hypothetical protein|nr:hypothetical protein [Gemmatimonadaceae bacterium]